MLGLFVSWLCLPLYVKIKKKNMLVNILKIFEEIFWVKNNLERILKKYLTGW